MLACVTEFLFVVEAGEWRGASDEDKEEEA